MGKNAKETVAERLDGLMSAFPALGSQVALAKKSGVGQTTIGRIRRGEVNATADNLQALAAAFGVPVGYLYGEGPDIVAKRPDGGFMMLEVKQTKADYNVVDAPNRGKLPLVSWVQAGDWTHIVDNLQPGDAEDWIPCPFNHGPHAFVLRVVGYSMHDPGSDKSYSPGDYIAVDPDAEPRNKRLVVVRLEGEDTATFKQLLIEPDGTHMLQALNPSWPQRITPMPPGSRIVGVVIGKWTPE